MTEYGYLERPYLIDDYLSGVVTDPRLSQVTRQINKEHAVGAQVARMIVDYAHLVGTEIDREIDSSHTVMSQVEARIDADHIVASQVSRNLSTEHIVSSQVEVRIDDTHAVASQVSQTINAEHIVAAQINRDLSTGHIVASQVEGRIDADHPVASQVEQIVNAEHVVAAQIDRNLSTMHEVPAQVARQVIEGHVVASQASLTVSSADSVQSEVDRLLVGEPHLVGAQVSRKIVAFPHTVGAEVRRGNVVHENCEDGGYLMLPYLTEPYLAGVICARMRTQVDRIVVHEHEVNAQVARKIEGFPHSVNTQVNRRIDSTHTVGAQVSRISSKTIHAQIARVLYNTKNLRILMDFPSRGSDGTNWTSNSTLAGDFSVNNLNTDIVEQAWRSNNTLSGVILTCDTEVPQGVFTDTLAFLNHNLTTSASVLWQASNDAGFATVPFAEELVMREDNFYWIAPTLPLTSYRYHRFLISDSTNPEAFLEIGTIVFGSSIVFQGECFVDRVRKGTKHFSDKVATEGYTNVSNDRAVKFNVGLEFRNIDYSKNNYRNIRTVFDTARTSLKCLWIPTPEFPERFATFAKLVQIPDEEHNVKGKDMDYIDFSITTDESL